MIDKPEIKNMTKIQFAEREITIEAQGQLIRLVWDEHMQEWVPRIPKH